MENSSVKTISTPTALNVFLEAIAGLVLSKVMELVKWYIVTSRVSTLIV